MAQTIASANAATAQLQILGNDLQVPITGQFQTISGISLLIQDIEQLLLTTPGERVNRPTYGCLVNTRVWENVSTMAIQGATDIQNAITNFEPRVTVLDVTPNIFPDEGIVTFVLRLVINSNNSPLNLVIPFKAANNLLTTGS
jgi:uncharacterized protein